MSQHTDNHLNRERHNLTHGKSLSRNMDLNTDLWFAAHLPPEEPKTTRFVGYSALLHLVSAAGLLVISQMPPPPQTETITIEIEEVTGPRRLPKGTAPRTAEGAAAPPPPARAARAAPRVKAQPAPAPAPAPSEVVTPPPTLDDLAPPELDPSSFAVDSPIESQAVSSLIEELDHQQPVIRPDDARALRESMEAETRAIEAEKESSFQALERSQTEQESRFEARANELRQRSEALAAASASRPTGTGRSIEAPSQARSMGLGASGDSGGTDPQKAMGTQGATKAIRALEDLRQMPGNPIPQYSKEERLYGQQGYVVFEAYISKSGVPVQFKQTRSTGYRNLDAKTLQALKKWKFYPGQEGWVEIPFSWDLQGGPQETPALNRSSRR